MSAIPGRRRPLLLELDLTQLPVSVDPGDPVARLRSRGRPHLAAVLRALHEAAADDRVAGLIAKVGGPLPWAGMQEVRLGIQAFARSGKPTVAWAESFAEGTADLTAYVLATAFDEIWLQPGGTLGPMGVAVQTTFVRGALDRLGIEPQLEQRHEYKNAADRVMRTEFTEAHRTSLDRLAESLFTDAISAVSLGRNLDEHHTRELVDAGTHTAEQAREAGLIDAVGYRDQAYAAMRARVPAEAELLFADRWRPRRRPHLPGRRTGHVALVEVRGTIVSGRSGPSVGMRRVGSDSITAALRSAAADEDAHAVLVHVDSPGGSAVASDTIWREVCRVRESGKPVIVAMGGVAASGGYYIACAADVILALPGTLTGSIGVIGGKVVTRELLDRIGLTTGTVAHGDRSLMYSTRRGFTEQEHAELNANIDAIYQDFVAKVAQGRRRPVSEIEAIARGRVWTGADALDVGLVDELGGLHDAVRIARARGGLPEAAPVRRAGQLAPVRRLGRAVNSEDPRATLGTTALGLANVSAALGLPPAATLRMSSLHVR